MKKIILYVSFVLLLFGSIFSSGYGEAVFALNQNPDPEQIYVTLETPLYESPNINASLIKENDETIYLSVGTVLNVDQDFSDKTFYKVKIYNIVQTANQNDTAYILIAHTLDNEYKSLQKRLDYNAVVKTDNAKIYKLNPNTNNYEETNITLSKDKKIRILDNGYEKNKEYTYISFYSNDNQIVSYYIKTADIHADGISYTIIAACLTLFACASIVLILLGIKGKKKKKLKNS